MYQYKTHGTCSQQILIDVDGDTIANVEFIGGCAGNTQGVARLAKGRKIDEVISLIKRVHTEMNQTILMIEHHMKLVMSIAQKIKVIDFGKTISEGNPEHVQNDPLVIAAYLGGDPDAHA